MGFNIVLWIIGPQLVGVVFVLIGWIQKTWPPKKINDLYGYRSDTSKKSQEAWDEGNRYAARYMIKAGVVCIVVGLPVSALLHYVKMQGDYKGVIMYMITLAGVMGSVLSMMVKTESHLERKFNQKKTE